ncbi:MAG: flagellar basal body P-ring formation protein FlgA [Bosea sp.]|uniref:flagellar basal body P-ring formation chaperone FlgA n=1 Tax=Bosea sp. (in: a-proteobacteria) TaxID=1871050 RepID=UPI002399ACC6|nr:flagellar basal body P-ring formation protein FlgA [Bosea sp. (in: a-proteobacteria)]MCP4738154.1 flagellar basal body P-ring formation protein FlgA [Bosea sp. (in: a-proteobacteria)]
MARVLVGFWLCAAAFLCAGAAAPLRAQTGEVMLPVPTITLYPGDLITDQHIVERPFRTGVRTPMAAIENRLAIVGKVARRTLLPGQPIPSNGIDDQKLVRRGVPTQVVFRENGLVITGIVEPMQAGAVNEMVKARNPDSGLTIIGIVQANGTIRVGME